MWSVGEIVDDTKLVCWRTENKSFFWWRSRRRAGRRIQCAGRNNDVIRDESGQAWRTVYSHRSRTSVVKIGGDGVRKARSYMNRISRLLQGLDTLRNGTNVVKLGGCWRHMNGFKPEDGPVRVRIRLNDKKKDDIVTMINKLIILTTALGLLIVQMRTSMWTTFRGNIRAWISQTGKKQGACVFFIREEKFNQRK